MRKETVKPNREYKDSVFVDLFSGKGEFSENNIVSLYNALHEQGINEKTQVKFIRLMNVLYHKLKNDVSCIINGKVLVLIEHQSTINENMPLRCLEYAVELYQSIIDAESKYEKKRIKIPSPEFYVFYNGRKEYAAREVQYLSKSFMQEQLEIQLELKVKVININHPENKELLNRCKILGEYKSFVDKVVEFIEEYGESGYDKAIEYCIGHGILEEYLKDNSKEVRNMLTAEYNYETELKVLRREAREEGREEGIKRGRGEGVCIAAQGMKKEGLDVSLIMRITGLSEEEIAKL